MLDESLQRTAISHNILVTRYCMRMLTFLELEFYPCLCCFISRLGVGENTMAQLCGYVAKLLITQDQTLWHLHTVAGAPPAHLVCLALKRL